MHPAASGVSLMRFDVFDAAGDAYAVSLVFTAGSAAAAASKGEKRNCYVILASCVVTKDFWVWE